MIYNIWPSYIIILQFLLLTKATCNLLFGEKQDFFKTMILLYFRVSPLIFLSVNSRVLHLFNTTNLLSSIAFFLFLQVCVSFGIFLPHLLLNRVGLEYNLILFLRVYLRNNFSHPFYFSFGSCSFKLNKRDSLTKRNIWIVNHDDILIRSWYNFL